MRKNKGFTLIELMIVVAIIAILAALAVPNFLKFVAKTRRAEVKYNLEAIYKAETCWFGEYNEFDNNFTTIRWEPAGTIYFYTFSVGGATKGLSIAVNPMPAGATSTANDNTFSAFGWGNIDNDNTVDIWYIDEMKNLVNVSDDLGT